MIPFNDYKKQYASVQMELDEAIKRVLLSGWHMQGKELELFDREFAAYLGANYCIGLASGTDAIALSLQAADIGQGDEVIVPCLTDFQTIRGIIQAGATPVVVDVDEYDGLIDVNKIDQKITAKTRAIIPVHLYGQSCEMEQLHHIASTHNLRLIEDCAHSAGTKYKHQFTGTYGIAAAFSFHHTKNLGVVGDGGAIVTNNLEVYEKCLNLINSSQVKSNSQSGEGINYRLDELQAAILRIKLIHLDIWNERRRQIAREYRIKIRTVDFIRENSYGTPNYHIFVVKCRERNRFVEYLQNNGIEVLIHYPVPINKQDAIPWQKTENFPSATFLSNHVISLPIYPELTNEEVDYIISTINNFS